MVGRLRYRPIQIMSRGTDLPLLGNQSLSLNRNRSHGFTNLNNRKHMFQSCQYSPCRWSLYTNTRNGMYTHEPMYILSRWLGRKHTRKFSINRKPELPPGGLFLHNRKKNLPFRGIILRNQREKLPNRKPELPPPEAKIRKVGSSMQQGGGYTRKPRSIKYSMSILGVDNFRVMFLSVSAMIIGIM